MKTSALVIACGVLSGCAHIYDLNTVQRAQAIDPKSAILVAVPEDGHFEAKRYEGSGKETANAIAMAFARHGNRVDVLKQPVGASDQLAAAREGKFDYLVVPEILHWEDRATEWSGKRDKIDIQIRTIVVGTGDQLTLGSIAGQSRYGSLFSGGGDVPQDLLAVPVKAYVDWLYSDPATPAPIPNAPGGQKRK